LGRVYFTINLRVKVPGEGMVMRETGRIGIDLSTGEILSETGHDDLLEGDTAAICEAFAP
jgi:hypothetical protein